MASLNSDGSGSGVPALGPFCYLCHAQQTKGTAAHPLIAMGDSLLLIIALLSGHSKNWMGGGHLSPIAALILRISCCID